MKHISCRKPEKIAQCVLQTLLTTFGIVDTTSFKSYSTFLLLVAGMSTLTYVSSITAITQKFMTVYDGFDTQLSWCGEVIINGVNKLKHALFYVWPELTTNPRIMHYTC